MTTFERPIAFVAMKFDSDAWTDQRYGVIREVLEEAGYIVKRSDEVPTSGVVVGEVSEYLQTAELVVIDSTGDSHSVTYEVGFVHGVGRSHATTVLIRQGIGGDIPFNFRHFRHLCYRDLRHLRRLLRERLELTRPISSSDVSYCFVWDASKADAVEASERVAEAVLAALDSLQFGGRCEYYAASRTVYAESHYCVSIALRHRNKALSFEEWSSLRDIVINCPRVSQVGLVFIEQLAEFGTVAGARGSFPARGVAEFKNGKPVRILGNTEPSSWFECAVCRMMDIHIDAPRMDPSIKLEIQSSPFSTHMHHVRTS